MKLADKMNGPIWIVWVVAVIYIIIAAVLISGHGSGMIAGYNMASKEEKEKYNEKKLCRVVGSGMAVIAALTVLMALLCKVLPAGFAHVYGAIVVLDCLVILILGNTICRK